MTQLEILEKIEILKKKLGKVELSDKAKNYISEISDKLLNELSDKQKKSIIKCENNDLHFTLGLHIRNVYLYPEWDKYKELQMSADDLSSYIIEDLNKKLKDGQI